MNRGGKLLLEFLKERVVDRRELSTHDVRHIENSLWVQVL